MDCTYDDSEGGSKSLSNIFDEGLEIYEEILKCEELSTSSTFQCKIKKCINLFEKATNLINLAGVFSSNEGIEEVPSENLKYFLLPALLGSLVLKLESSDRFNNLETAEIYFKDFVKRLQDYEVISRARIEAVEGENVEAPPKKLTLEDMAGQRNEKIRKYKEQKELEKELQRLKSLMKNSDDETCREYYLTYLKTYLNISSDELNSIRQEKPLAKHMAEVRQGKTFVKNEAKEQLDNKHFAKPLRPVIITRNEVQKKVFGAGYPSLPTMTVNEFYEQRVEEGIFPAQGSSYSKTLQELSDPIVAKEEEVRKEIQKENEIERDDMECLMRLREMDEYKDHHKRGWGNRWNKS